MIAFRDMPVRRKLTLLVTLTCAATLAIACGAFVAYDIVDLRREIAEDLANLAEVTSINATTALESGRPESAAKTLSALRVEPNVVAAFIYDRGGNVFARFDRDGTPTAAPIPFTDARHGFTVHEIRHFRPIVHNGEVIGAIGIVSDLSDVFAHIRRYAVIGALVMGVSTLVVFQLSAYVERLVARPILNLATLSRTVALNNDYTRRARRENNDEIGQLVGRFNHMLEQIEARDAELRAAQLHLERRVEERTLALQKAQEAVERQKARCTFIFDSLPVGVSWMHNGDVKTRIVNPALARIVGIAPDRCHDEDLFRLATHPDDRARQSEVHGQLLAGTIDHYSVQKRYVHADGAVRWAALTVRLFRDATSGDTQEIGTIVDITDQKKSESELEDIHKQLLDTSRQAGMAEVATGVLHNVGNVLNSVNVSATLVAEGIRSSETEKVSRVGALLRQHEGDLAHFLANDPKGRQIPGFLDTLGAHLASEREHLLQEIETLRKNVEHIKEIVAMQQSYAKISGVSESVSVAELVEDALRMNAGALVRHDVRLVRDYQSRAIVNVEKHKVLQILVNLVRNAKYACDDSGRADKRLTVRIVQDERCVRICVIDNGVGIPPENLTRIFAHGFTTRANGHGFGLHSGALAARELGGSLTVESAGHGHGASFILELPFERKAVAA